MNEYIKETMTTWPKRLVVPVLLAALVLGGCDTTVTNPGPVQDANIDDPGAFQALVNGAGRAVAQTMQWHAYTGGVVVLEIVGSGNITDHGVSLNHNEGKLLPDNQETDQWWNMANRARWTSEEAVRRIQSAGGFDTSQLGAEALVWVGFANRLMGEESCVSVIDGGSAGSRTVYFERAEAAFTEAMDIAGGIGETQTALAAQAGRAAARVWLGNWSGAMADATAVPKDFKFVAEYFALDDEQHNRMFWAINGQPFRAQSVFGTFYETYGATAGDPRVTWDSDPQYPTGSQGVPFLFQTKYTGRESPIDLADGREMLLIRAEGHLRASEMPEAVLLMNEIRTDVGLGNVTPATMDEAWTALRQERAVEFWLEDRQLGDLWRWENEGAPGTHIQEAALQGRDRCFPIGDTEINTNPNISGPNG
ncbi:MAG: RagB/SusD family nutrient uptake outer membrane protein [Planctomycetota bacterium]|jgi:hypothetical protein